MTVERSGWNATDWSRAGYIEMVSPIRPPGSSHGRLRILVFLKIPEGSPVRAQRAADGRVGLQLPFGTRAERVEVLGDTERDSTADARWRILDVRGTEWTESGRVFRVLRTAPSQVEVVGLRWPEAAQAACSTSPQYARSPRRSQSAMRRADRTRTMLARARRYSGWSGRPVLPVHP